MVLRCASRKKLLVLERLVVNLRQILHGHGRIVEGHTIREHGQAERAGRHERIGMRLKRLFGTHMVDLLARRFFEPHVAAARTATEALRLVALHLVQLDLRSLREYRARRIILPMVAP